MLANMQQEVAVNILYATFLQIFKYYYLFELDTQFCADLFM